MTSEYTGHRSGAAGFTLLEMLVVLLIAGMAMALTVQALGQYRRAHASATASERAGRAYRLGESWWRDSVRALVAAPVTVDTATDFDIDALKDRPSPVFAGRSDGFSGLTLAPVLAGQGVPVVQRWQVAPGPAGTEVLELYEQDRRLLLSLPGQGGLRFHYLDEDGQVHRQWPPAKGVWRQLPAAVVLEVQPGRDGEGGHTLVAAVMGPREPMQRPYEPEPF